MALKNKCPRAPLTVHLSNEKESYLLTMSDRLLCRKWGGNRKEIRDSEDDGKENTNSWSVQYCLTFSKSKHNILGVLTVRTGNKAASEQCFRFGFSPTHLFLWATNLHWTANICLTLFPMFSLVLLIKSPSSFPPPQPHEPPQGHQSPPASGLHGGNYLCSLRADNPSIESLLSSPPRSSSLLFPSFIVSFVWNI